MGRPSTIKRLPPQVRERLNAWIRDESVTQSEAAALVNQMLAELYPGHPRVSRMAVNRYDLSMREAGEKIRQAREISEVWIAKLGSAPGGRTGHLITEMIRTMVFEVMQRLQEGELDGDSMPDVIEQLKSLALTAARVERAAAISVKRERELKLQAAEELAERAAADGGGEAVSPERLREIAREVYGVG